MDSPQHDPSIIPLTVSITGDFSDVFSSIPFRYYKEVKNLTKFLILFLSLLSIIFTQDMVLKMVTPLLKFLEKTF